MTRHHFAREATKNGDEFITIGDYFRVARLFFERIGIEMLANAFRRRFKHDIRSKDITQISIFLLKHGEFYHPSRIEASVDDWQIDCVLNVAFSQTGQNTIKDEYCVLKRLAQEFAFAYLPQVYGRDEAFISADYKIAMFLGEWLNNYYEFHISRDPADNQNKIVVWDSKRGDYFLSTNQSLNLYSQAAGILTSYYNLTSFEQICSWHHAAGDFVIRLENEKVDLKLITVRRYASTFNNTNDLKNAENNAELILQALLVFFLDLCLKMRLDRLDGVGDIIWADNTAVQGTLIGFLNALDLKANVPALPDTPLRCFYQYLSLCSKTDLHELSKAILKTFNPDAEEVDVIRQHLDSHVDILHHCIGQL
ncbi:MAG: hypothetical protein PVF56_01825 [Desulfobacterales bacterium]|jgi:hypothetical protein